MALQKIFPPVLHKSLGRNRVRDQHTTDHAEPIRCPACTVRDEFAELIQIESDVRKKIDAENKPVLIFFGRGGRRGNMIQLVRRQDLPRLIFATAAVASVAVLASAIVYMRQS